MLPWTDGKSVSSSFYRVRTPLWGSGLVLTLAGLKLCPLSLQGWRRPLSTAGVCICSDTPLAPAHCSVLDSGVFSPLECGFIFFLLNLTMCLNIFSSLCVCFYCGRGPPLSVQPAVLQFLKCKRPRTETWDPMT